MSKKDNDLNRNIDLIDKLDYYINLFDFYENLFTEKQKEYFKDYYFYDLSLSEIAENYKVSRSAVYDAINKMHQALEEYENKLSLYKKTIARRNIIDEYEQVANKANNELTLELIKKIKENE